MKSTAKSAIARRVLVVILVIALLAAWTGCNGEPVETDIDTGGPGAETGGPEAAEEITEEPPEPEPLPDVDFTIDASRLDGSTATFPLMEATLKKLFGSAEGLVHNKTNFAYSALIGLYDWYIEEFGEKDAIFVTYPSEGEFAQAKEAGIEFEIIPIVKDALVFLVNADNPVSNLTRQQVKDVYTGKIDNWKDVGGRDEPITPFQRVVDSGSQTLFLKLAMEGAAPMEAPTELRPGDMSGLIDSVASNDYSGSAIGYSVFYYASEMYARDEVKLISIDGVMPTPETISGDEYPYPTYYYAVLRNDTAEDADARKLIAWMLSPDGQRTASAAGYVPLNADDLQPADPMGSYGYYGSTPENTTMSSGTGGAKPKFAGAMASRKPILTGKDAKLSDLFYDGVNYIDYINRALRTVIEYDDWHMQQKHRFTGVPNDYPLFELKKYDYYNGKTGGLALCLIFYKDNPFFLGDMFDYESGEMSMAINLPMDLSPYGAVSEISHIKEQQDGYNVLVPQVKTYFKGRNPVDEKVNAGIRALYDKAVAAGYFGPDPDYKIRGMDENVAAGVFIIRDKIGVEFYREAYGHNDKIVAAFDLGTGDEVRTPVFTNARASSTRAPADGMTFSAKSVLREHESFGPYDYAWCEGIPGPGIGEWIEFSAGSKQRVDGIKLLNGRFSSHQDYVDANRVKALTVTAENGFSESFVLPEDIEQPWYQYIEFNAPAYTSWLRLTIDDIYGGYIDKENTYITEIYIR